MNASTADGHDAPRLRVRAAVSGQERSRISTGLPVLDHLIGLLAALCAEGRSEIGNIRQIDRGYERIDERLRDLGAHIERVATEPTHA